MWWERALECELPTEGEEGQFDRRDHPIWGSKWDVTRPRVRLWHFNVAPVQPNCSLERLKIPPTPTQANYIRPNKLLQAVGVNWSEAVCQLRPGQQQKRARLMQICFNENKLSQHLARAVKLVWQHPQLKNYFARSPCCAFQIYQQGVTRYLETSREHELPPLRIGVTPGVSQDNSLILLLFHKYMYMRYMILGTYVIFTPVLCGFGKVAETIM